MAMVRAQNQSKANIFHCKRSTRAKAKLTVLAICFAGAWLCGGKTGLIGRIWPALRLQRDPGALAIGFLIAGLRRGQAGSPCGGNSNKWGDPTADSAIVAAYHSPDILQSYYGKSLSCGQSANGPPQPAPEGRIFITSWMNTSSEFSLLKAFEKNKIGCSALNAKQQTAGSTGDAISHALRS